MRRREFITFLGGAAAAWPLAARAQPTNKIARIGFLGSATAAGSAQSVSTLREGLSALGYVEGKNIILEFRWAEGKYDRLLELVTDLISLNVDVLVTHGTPGTQTAKRATNNIPIVMAISGDAVATGIVTNLGRPEANVTGSTFFLPELNAKRLELLTEVLPAARYSRRRAFQPRQSGEQTNHSCDEGCRRAFKIGNRSVRGSGPKRFHRCI
jgi:ABC-type uncharacterized transport system substrate-binding protein